MVKHDGSMLLEVLICVVLLNMLLFLITPLQNSFLRRTQAVYFYSLALQQLNSLQALLILDPSGGLLKEWNREIAALLPQGKVKLQKNALWLCWQEIISTREICLKRKRADEVV